MPLLELGNPFWFSLRSRRRDMAQCVGDVARYPPECTPFLHVSHENVRARQLYEQLGYRHRRDIPFWSLYRAKS